MFESLPDRVSVYEVSPRDGLQNETAIVPTTKKKRLLDALAASGLARIEMTSFVSPRWVPQLADADDLCALVDQRDPGVVYSALCPNEKGLERAIQGGVREIGMFVSASETHNKKNVNKTIDETLAVFEPVCVGARAAGIAVRGYVSCLWGCPYEGGEDVLALPDRTATRDVDELPARDRQQPALGIARHRRARPLLERGGEGVGEGIFGARQIAEASREVREQSAVRLSGDVFRGRACVHFNLAGAGPAGSRCCPRPRWDSRPPTGWPDRATARR